MKVTSEIHVSIEWEENVTLRCCAYVGIKRHENGSFVEAEDKVASPDLQMPSNRYHSGHSATIKQFLAI